MELKPSPTPSPSRLVRCCLGRTKVNKPCQMQVDEGQLFCSHHKQQEEEYYRTQELLVHPLFKDKTEQQIRDLAKQYHIPADARYKNMDNIKKKILEVKPIYDRREERNKKIETLNLSLNELETEEEKELYAEVQGIRTKRLSIIQDDLNQILYGERKFIEDENGPIKGVVHNFRLGDYLGSKHNAYQNLNLPHQRSKTNLDQETLKIVIKILDTRASNLMKKESDDYFEDLKMEYEMLASGNMVMTDYKDIRNQWKSELKKEPSSRYQRVVQAIQSIYNDSDNWTEIIEYKQYIPDAPDFCIDTDLYEPLKIVITKDHLQMKQKRFERMYHLRLNLDNFFTFEEQKYWSAKLFNCCSEKNYWIYKNGTPEEIEKENSKPQLSYFGGFFRKESDYNAFKSSILKWYAKTKPEERTYEIVKARFPDWIRNEDHYQDVNDLYEEELWEQKETASKAQQQEELVKNPKKKTSTKKTKTTAHHK